MKKNPVCLLAAIAVCMGLFLFSSCSSTSATAPGSKGGAPGKTQASQPVIITITIEDASKLLGDSALSAAQREINWKGFEKQYKTVTGKGYVRAVTDVDNRFTAVLCTNSKHACTTYKDQEVQLLVHLENVPDGQALSWNRGDTVEFSGKVRSYKPKKRELFLTNIQSKKD